MDIEIKPKNQFLKKYGWMIAAGVVLVAVLVYAVLSVGTTSAEADINSIIIGDVTRGSFNDNIRLTGKVETGVSAQVSALETGVVEARLIEEGAFVNAGDIILTLRNPN
ncbi:MAG: HlyD family secretion protein, partial [Muribaculaceae bacterium]|nr:HlyD family secretion protein [Muribaculaceae bacterium]